MAGVRKRYAAGRAKKGGEVSTNQTADVLRRARARIEPREKWGQGLPRSRKGTFCAVEAIRWVCIRTVGSSEESSFKILRKAINVGPYDAITTWNDKSERTHAEVLAAFDRAIELAEAS